MSGANDVSADGRYVVFTVGSNIYHLDRQTGEEKLVTVTSGGGPADQDSIEPSVSDDGRYVVFSSWASDLVQSDTNERADVFVRDVVAGTTRLVSVGSRGTQLAGGSMSGTISANGQRAAYLTWDDEFAGPGDGVAIVVADLVAGGVTTVSSESGGIVSAPTISADGDRIAWSTSTPTGPADQDETLDVFLYIVSESRRVVVSRGWDGSVPDGGSYDPVISDDGSQIAFTSEAGNLLESGDAAGTDDVFTYGVADGRIERIAEGYASNLALSANGMVVAFETDNALVSTDTNEWYDVYVKDRQSGVLRRASEPSSGRDPSFNSFSPAVTADGSETLFSSEATNMIDGTVVSDSAMYVSKPGEYVPPTDTEPPVASLTGFTSPHEKNVPNFTTWTSVRLGFTGTDNVAIDHYELRYRTAKYNGTFGSWRALAGWNNLRGSSVTTPNFMSQGYTYCFSVRAMDTAENFSPWSTEKCTARLIDDASAVFAYSSGWTRTTGGTGWWKGTVSQTSTTGQTIRTGTVNATKIGVYGLSCPSCGQVEVAIGGVNLGRLSFTSSTTAEVKKVVSVPRFVKRTGVITITVVSSGKVVRVDGLGISQTTS